MLRRLFDGATTDRHAQVMQHKACFILLFFYSFQLGHNVK